MSEARSYREILRSTALIGGASAATVCIGIVRTKAMAMILGPAGFGLMGTYVVIVDLARSVAQLGLNASGVRLIADAVATGDTDRVARTVTVLRRTSLACAFVGAALLALLAAPVARFTFGGEGHAPAVGLLSLALFFSLVASGQGALLQGMRRIGDLARLTVLGGLLGTVIGVPMVYFFGLEGLVPTLIVVSACAWASAWWFSRRIRPDTPHMSLAETAAESASLLKLGLAFMASGLLMAGAAYAVRVVVLREAGLDAAGVYLAAWTLGGLYVGFVMHAMETDFYPRLVGVAAENAECNRLVNEQAQVSLLLALPGVLATLTLASPAIAVFYSAQFAPAAEVLRWICVGMALRVLTWPIGYIVVAKNRQVLFLGIEIAWTVVNVGLTWWLVAEFGARGAGMAFCASYVFHGLLVYPIVRRLSGFRWTKGNRNTALCSAAAIAAVFGGFQMLPPHAALALGIGVTVLSSQASLRYLMRLVEPQRLPRPLARLLG